MSKVLQRFLGIILILTAIGGLLFSILGISGVWRIKPTLTTALVNSIELTMDTLDATSSGLAVIETTLSGAVVSMQGLQDTLFTTAEALKSTEPMLNSVVEMMDNDLPSTIAATRTSLETAQESAKIIDSVLEALSIFPFVTYEPEKPLHESLDDISNRLGEFPASFENISESLDASRDQLQILQADLSVMSEAVNQIETGLDDSEQVLAQYNKSIKIAEGKLADLEEQIPMFVDGAVWIVTLFLLWMAFAQIGLFTQGVDLIRKEEVVVEESSIDND